MLKKCHRNNMVLPNYSLLALDHEYKSVGSIYNSIVAIRRLIRAIFL